MQKRKKRERPPLSELHYAAIQMLSKAPTPNHADIARKLKICRMTVYRWRQRADFQRALDRAIKAEVRKSVPKTKLTYDAEHITKVLRFNGLLA